MVKHIDPAIFIGKFVEEARDRLRSLSEDLLDLEKNPQTGEKLQEVLRQAHTLKGSAKMLGLNDISQVAHGMEDMFVFVKEGSVPLSPGAYDILFESVDLLSSRVEELANGIKEPMNVAPFIRRFEAFSVSFQAATQGREPKAEKPVFPRYSAVPLEAGPRTESPPSPAPDVKRSLRVSADKIDELANLAAEMVIQNLQMSERHTELRRIESLLRHFKDRVREMRQGLTGSKNGLGLQLAEQIESLEGIGRRVGQFVADFSGDQARMNLITEELRQNVIGLTMLPMSTVFDSFPRAARDLARDFDKEVDLTVQGSETELDKKIIEQIGDSLVHLVRNAIDHGIESPEERERLGKPRRGEILLSAQQQGNRIVIGIQDDGRGINPAELRYVAVRKGLVAETDLDRWKEKDLLNLIFYPGFSTSRSVTDVSGRGVGMDVVKITVERLQGAVNVDSRVGKGTSIVLDLPVSLALLRALLVEVRGELFAVPTGVLDRILYIKPEQIRVLQEGQVVDVGGESIPLVSMGGLLKLPTPVNPSLRQAVVVARAFTRRFGMMVDVVHEEQEFVFKELRGRLRNQRLFSGVSILGSGQLVLILEVNEVFQIATRSPGASAPFAAEVVQELVPASILVVEDSYITGELERGILHAAGYRAEVAQDGVDALEALQKKKYDLVIADVDMPRMDGFELTSRMREDERMRDIPVIIVTSRESPADRRRGIEVGADAYIMKREFDQNHLLETVQRLIGR